MTKKCRKCRDGKRNANFSPKRPPRGSIRKAKRMEMRRQKNLNMVRLQADRANGTSGPVLASEKSHHRGVEFGGGNAISQSVVSVDNLDVETITESGETEQVEGVLPTMPDEEVVD